MSKKRAKARGRRTVPHCTDYSSALDHLYNCSMTEQIQERLISEGVIVPAKRLVGKIWLFECLNCGVQLVVDGDSIVAHYPPAVLHNPDVYATQTCDCGARMRCVREIPVWEYRTIRETATQV